MALSLSWLLGAIVSKRFGWRHYWWRWVALPLLAALPLPLPLPLPPYPHTPNPHTPIPPNPLAIIRWVGVALLQPGYLVFKIPEIFAYELCRKAYINCTDLQYDTDIQRYEQVRGAIHLARLYLLCAGIQWYELVERLRTHVAVLTLALATLRPCTQVWEMPIYVVAACSIIARVVTCAMLRRASALDLVSSKDGASGLDMVGGATQWQLPRDLAAGLWTSRAHLRRMVRPLILTLTLTLTPTLSLTLTLTLALTSAVWCAP